MSMGGVQYTLPGRDYHAAEVFEVERERVFFRHWFYAGRVEALAEAGAFAAVDVVGESILLVRGKDGELRGFYNVCRHRGSRLCEEESTGKLRAAIKCPYHAWSYSLDGRLVGTPLMGKDELDRADYGLWPVTVETWEGFVFVHLGQPTEGLRDSLAAQGEGSAVEYERFGFGQLHSGHQTVSEVAANWKILVENYNECMHCPTVHPELVAVAPAFRTGNVFEEGRNDYGITMAGGGSGYTKTGTTSLPLLPGIDEHDATSMYGASVFPNMFLDMTGTVAIATRLQPRGPAHTTIITDYLFRPETIAEPGFDPSEAVEFSELVAHQDYVVCERAQKGVSSRAFTHGVFAEKDALPYAFNQEYLKARDE
jgi:phenylpropionate dioxygenase-like ring-hydroxylating dioxygenase large terminal subunit